MKEVLIIFVIALIAGSVLNSLGDLSHQGQSGTGQAGSTARASDTSTVPKVTDATFASEVLSSEKPVMVDFWAPWCGPCRAMTPIVENVHNRYSESMKVVRMNTDENPQTAQSYQIDSIPRLYIFKGGKLIERIQGAAPESEVTALVEKTLALDAK